MEEFLQKARPGRPGVPRRRGISHAGKDRALSESTPAKVESPHRRLSREERRELLKRLERASSRSESAEAVLARVEQAIRDGRLEEARNFLVHLQATAPSLAGLDLVGDKLEEAEAEAERAQRVRTAEEILSRYIQQRKKKLAELALETLAELEPQHPRLADYRVWVGELDREVAFHRRLEKIAAAGREAIQGGRLKVARRRLADLEKLDSDSPAAAGLAAEIESASRGREQSVDIERSKERLEVLLARGEVDRAEAELERLADTEVSKITLDFLRKRLDDLQSDREVRSRMATLRRSFREHLARRDWDAAREVAQKAGEEVGTPELTAEMFQQVDRREAELRRRQSTDEGVGMLRKFLSEGRKQEAELALQLLRKLGLEPEEIRELERRVAEL